MPKKRGPRKNRKKQSSEKQASRNTKDESIEGPSTDPQGTAVDEGEALSNMNMDAATAVTEMRLNEEESQRDSMNVLQNNSSFGNQPLGNEENEENYLDRLQELTELTLWKASEVISADKFLPLGLKLGLTNTRLMNILAGVVQHEEKTFKMLHEWYRNTEGDQSKFLFGVLTSEGELDKEQVFKLFFEEQHTCQGFFGRAFQDFQLHEIAEELQVDKLIPLGLRLGLTYSKICHIREGSRSHSVNPCYTIMMQWREEQTVQIDQVETLARVLAACHERKLAYQIRQDHLRVTNEKKTLLISEDKPMEGVSEVQLIVTHSNQLVREEAQRRLQAVLEAGFSETSLVLSTGGGAAAEFLEGLKECSRLFKRYSHLVKSLEKTIGRDGMYKLIGLTVDSIHFHVRVYTIEGLKCLQTDIESGRIGHELAKVLISEEFKQQITGDIVLDVAAEGNSTWDLLTHAVNDPHEQFTGQPKELEQTDTMNVDVQQPTVKSHEEDHSGARCGSSSLATPKVPISQEMSDDVGNKGSDSETHTQETFSSEASKKMEDWTEEDVVFWLKNHVHFSDEIVSKFEGVDGFTLVKYTTAKLKEDFELSTGYCRRLDERKNDYLEKEQIGRGNSRGSDSSESCDRISKVSVLEQVLISPEPEGFPPSPASVPYVHTPVQQAEYMQTPSLLANISGPSIYRDGPDKKHTETSASLAEVSVASPEELEPQCTSSFTSSPSTTETDSTVPPCGHTEMQKSVHRPSETGGKESDSDREKRLTNLLLGSDKGELDSSYYPVLVVNTPPHQMSPAEVGERFGFMASVNWNVVFDCNADSNKVGLCQYVNQRKSIKILDADTFSDTKDVDELRDGIDFPEIPVWVFPNGRNDVNMQQMEKLPDIDWTRERSYAVLNTVRFFSDPGVIPPGRAVVVFLLLSYSDIMVMTQLFKEFYTSKSFQDLKRFTIIAEDRGVLHKWIQHLESQSIVSSKNMMERCLGGMEWQEINTYMMRLLGSCETGLPVLPMVPRGECELTKKHQSQWSDIFVLPKNECENTSMDDNNPKFLDFVQDKESRFYQGHGVDWWNFYLSEKKLNGGKGYNHVLKRQNYKRLHDNVLRLLTSPGKKVYHISMATVFHEPGAGGTTVAKNLLWDLHRDYRCAVVNRVTDNTVKQILAFHKYGYEEGQKPGPVVLLLENLDSETMRPFLINLEGKTRYLEDNGVAFVLVHCKRTSEPQFLQKKEEPNPCVCVEHKLSKEEKVWFSKKTRDLEQKHVFSEENSPYKLLTFMVMKKECDPAYLRKVVKGILSQLDINFDKKLKNGVNLLKYISVIQRYNPDFAMPVSACDGFMKRRYRLTSGGRHQSLVPWEKDKPQYLNLLLREEFIEDIDGCVKGLSIVHPVIATEIVHQLGETSQQTTADMFLELLEKTTILDNLSYSKGYVKKVCRDLMVRRLKKEYGDDKETSFAPFIEDVYKENSEKAFKIMEVGIQKFQDPYIAQQKARLHSLLENDFENAEQAINIALGIASNNSYFWDTKGIILREKMAQYDRKEDHEIISDDEMKSLLDTFDQSCSAFQKAQQVMEEETTGRNYAGFSGEIATIAKFLEIVLKRVEPFCNYSKKEGIKILQMYLVTEYIPRDLKLQSLLDFSATMKSLSERVDKAFLCFTDYLTHCAKQRFDGPSVRIHDTKTERMYSTRNRFFALSSQHHEKENEYSQYPVETVYAMRRSEVKRMYADGYHNIFDMASTSKVEDLRRAQSLLQQNLDSPNLFDIRNYVFTVFALSVCNNGVLNEEEARKSVNMLKMMEEEGNGFYGLFFEMLLNWPDGTRIARRTPIRDTIQKLREKWERRYSNKTHADSQLNRSKRSRFRAISIPCKASTEFYLGQDKKSQFVHRYSIGRRVTYDTWREDSIKKRLRRLDGVLGSKHFVLYNPEGQEPMKITLSLPIKGLPSQEPVQFYLGFSFAGPIAYDVVYKDNRETPFIAKESSANYPNYVNELPDIDES